MSVQDDVSEFLRTRRARVTPEQAGLVSYGGTRRVPGLRREEVALLAGVSVDYYIRMERGSLAGVSDQVLEALARVLRLDEAERGHLFDLAKASTRPGRRPRRQPSTRVRPGVLRILDSLEGPPTCATNGWTSWPPTTWPTRCMTASSTATGCR